MNLFRKVTLQTNNTINIIRSVPLIDLSQVVSFETFTLQVYSYQLMWNIFYFSVSRLEFTFQ